MASKNVDINISTGTVLKILGLILILSFLYFIRDIILLVFIAIIFSAILDPLVNRFQEWGKRLLNRNIPRSLIVILLYILIFLFLFIIVRLIIPPIIQQTSLLIYNFPDLWSRFIDNFSSIRQFSENKLIIYDFQRNFLSFQSGLQTAAGGVYSFLTSVFNSLVNFFLVLVIIFYLVVEKNSIHKLVRAVAPSKYQSYLITIFGEIQTKIGAWARAELMLVAIIGIFSFIGLLFLLPKYALVLALFAGVTELIPYLGPIMGGVPAVFLGFAMPPFSFGRGIAVLILYIIIQQFEEKLIVPKIMQREVGLNPVVTIIVMLIGFRVAGIIGLVLAIPVTTAIGIVAKDLLNRYEQAQVKAKINRNSTVD